MPLGLKKYHQHSFFFAVDFGTIFAVDFASKYFARILVIRNTFSTLRAKLLLANFGWDNETSRAVLIGGAGACPSNCEALSGEVVGTYVCRL